MENKKLIIDRVKFLNWYFEGNISHKKFNDLSGSLFKLKKLLDTTGYIPEWILVEGQDYLLDANGDVDESNVKLTFN